MQYDIVSLAEQPDLIQSIQQIHEQAWPEFLLQAEALKRYWAELMVTFAGYQLVLLEKGRLIGVSHGIPIKWVGALEDLPSGRDGALEKGFADHKKALHPTTLVGLSMVVAPEYQGKNLSRMLLSTLKDVALRQEIRNLIVPVRPTLKSRYPEMPMGDYLSKSQRDGLPFDPWIRTHLKLGAKFLSIAHQSIVVTGGIAEWEKWTRMKFRRSGEIPVPGALVPVYIDKKKNLGLYEEPNVWVKYDLGG